MTNSTPTEQTFVQKLCAILVKQGVFTEKNAAEFSILFEESPKENFDDFLLEEGLITRDDLLNALSIYYQVPAFDVRGHFFNHQLVTIFPKGELHRNACIPLRLEEDILTVVASEPTNPKVRDFINEYVDFGVEIYAGIRKNITSAITEFYDTALTEVSDDEELDEEDQEELEQIAMGNLPEDKG